MCIVAARICMCILYMFICEYMQDSLKGGDPLLIVVASWSRQREAAGGIDMDTLNSIFLC